MKEMPLNYIRVLKRPGLRPEPILRSRAICRWVKLSDFRIISDGRNEAVRLVQNNDWLLWGMLFDAEQTSTFQHQKKWFTLPFRRSSQRLWLQGILPGMPDFSLFDFTKNKCIYFEVLKLIETSKPSNISSRIGVKLRDLPRFRQYKEKK